MELYLIFETTKFFSQYFSFTHPNISRPINFSFCSQFSAASPQSKRLEQSFSSAFKAGSSKTCLKFLYHFSGICWVLLLLLFWLLVGAIVIPLIILYFALVCLCAMCDDDK